MKNRIVQTIIPAATLFALSLTGCTDAGQTGPPAIDFNPSATRTLVTTLGTDTLYVEEYTRSENEISGRLVARTPSTYAISFAGDFAEDGTIQHFSAERYGWKDDGTKAISFAWTVSVADGQATVVREGGQNPGSTTMEVPHGTIPTLGRSTAAGFVFEQVSKQLAIAESENRDTWLLTPTGTAPRQNASQSVSSDSISMDHFGSPRYAWFGDDMQILGESGRATTMKSETRRSLPLDITDLARRWVGLDSTGRGIGTPSPGAEVSRNIAGTDLEIVYSQPAKRGRDIWGSLVPYNEVWRTGANAATMFSTSKDLVIEGTPVPAGSYTLWTTFTSDSQTLIINSETGQWGTAYDEDKDFARIAMNKSTVPSNAERFTISADEVDGGGTLNLDWDETRFSVRFSVK